MYVWLTYHSWHLGMSESAHKNPFRSLSELHPFLEDFTTFNIVFFSVLCRRTWKPPNMCVGCVWPDSSSIRLTRAACKWLILPFLPDSLLFFIISCKCLLLSLTSALLSSSLFREDCDPLPSVVSQKSLLTLSFPRFPMLSRPSLPSNKGWAKVGHHLNANSSPFLNALPNSTWVIYIWNGPQIK